MVIYLDENVFIVKQLHTCFLFSYLFKGFQTDKWNLMSVKRNADIVDRYFSKTG